MNVLLIIFFVKRTAFADKCIPSLRAFFSGEQFAFVVHILEHIDHIFRNFHFECGTGSRAHNCKCLASGSLCDLLLLALVDSAGLLIQSAKVGNIVRCKREDKTVLAGIDDCRGFTRNFLAADKVLNVLRNNDLHTVVLTDTLCQLEHKVKRDRIFRIDEDMGLVDNNHDLTIQFISCVIITVLDDLVVNVLQYQQHLRICNGGVAVR